MYHIVKSKDQFMVVLVGKNGEPLSTSERFTTKAKAWGNVRAQLKAANNPYAYTQDDTLGIPSVYRVYYEGSKIRTADLAISPRYKPGKAIRALYHHKKKKV